MKHERILIPSDHEAVSEADGCAISAGLSVQRKPKKSLTRTAVRVPLKLGRRYVTKPRRILTDSLLAACAAIAAGNMMQQLTQIDEVSFSTTCSYRTSETRIISDQVTSTYDYNKGKLSFDPQGGEHTVFANLIDPNPATAVRACAIYLQEIGSGGLEDADIRISIGTLGQTLNTNDLGSGASNYTDNMSSADLQDLADQSEILANDTAGIVLQFTGEVPKDTGIWGSIKTSAYDGYKKTETLVHEQSPVLFNIGSAAMYLADTIQTGASYWLPGESGYSIRGAFRFEKAGEETAPEVTTYATVKLPAVLPSDAKNLGTIVHFTRPQDAMQAFSEACARNNKAQCAYVYQLYYNGKPVALGNRSYVTGDFKAANVGLARDYGQLTSWPQRVTHLASDTFLKLYGRNW